MKSEFVMIRYVGIFWFVIIIVLIRISQLLQMARAKFADAQHQPSE